MKKVQVVWSTEALNDLEMIYDFLAESSQRAAQKIVETILSKTKQLEVFPESGARQQVSKTRARQYRYLIEGHYKIIYSYHRKNQVSFIHTIFDTRFNPEKLKL